MRPALPVLIGAADRPVVLPRMGFPFRLLVLLAFLPLLLGASILVLYRQQYVDRIYPGVSIIGVDVGRQTREEAAAAVKRHLVERSRGPFLLRYEDGAVTVSLAALGLKIDDAELAQLAERAWAVGREERLRAWLRSQLDLLRSGYALPAAAGLDREQASAVLGRVAVDVERPTVNAGLNVAKAGERFEVHTTPAQVGRRLNLNATLDRLERALAGALPGAIDLVLDEAPPAIGDADLLPAIDTIQVLLGSPLEFKDGARVWKLEPDAAFDMLEITGVDVGRPPIGAKLADAKLRAFVERVARAADDPAKNAVFDVEGDRVVVRRGTPGKLADANATFELAKERALAPSPGRTVDIVFVEDRPWVTEADLEPARAQANRLLDLPITLEAPAPPEPAERKWVLNRAQLAQMLVLPPTQTVPREYATLPVQQRPKFEIALDSGKVTNYLAREVAPWVSEDPVDAELQLKKTVVEVPNPAREAGRTDVPPTLQETRYAVEVRNARDGRGPDYMATFAAMQVLFRAGQPADPAERRVTVRLALRPPRVQDRDVAAARDTANLLVGEPVIVRWQDAAWTITRDELASMFRYQPAGDGVMAYLTRDGLLAKASAIAREAERRPDAPKDRAGKPLPVDVPATAAAIWQQASTAAANRVAGVVWSEDSAADATADAQA